MSLKSVPSACRKLSSLTFQQPWATLLAFGAKRFETSPPASIGVNGGQACGDPRRQEWSRPDTGSRARAYGALAGRRWVFRRHSAYGNGCWHGAPQRLLSDRPTRWVGVLVGGDRGRLAAMRTNRTLRTGTTVRRICPRSLALAVQQARSVPSWLGNGQVVAND